MKKKIHFLLLLVWMSFIYIMSSQTGQESSQTSESVVEVFGLMNGNFSSLFHFLIRKGAHLFEYMILSLLFYLFIKEFIKNKKITYYYTMFFCILYASLDELHQLFVANRHSSIIDVIIDTIGALIGIILIVFYNKWSQKMNLTLNK